MSSAIIDHPQKACETFQNTAVVSLADFIWRCRSTTEWTDLSLRLEFSRGLGNEPALQGLLRVYKDYYPEIILGSAATSRKSFAPVRPIYLV
jgi:hypothetical protein